MTIVTLNHKSNLHALIHSYIIGPTFAYRQQNNLYKILFKLWKKVKGMFIYKELKNKNNKDLFF